MHKGFLYGNGIFTTIKTREGIPLFLERHINRLQTSAAQLDIQSSAIRNSSYVRKSVYSAIAKNKLIDGAIRITVTDGKINTQTFTIKQFSNEAIRLITIPDPRDIYKIHKLTYRIPNLLARQQAEKKGAQDALFTQNGEIIESTTANIIAYINKDTLITPPISGKGLDGITRQILMENLPIHESPIPQNTTNPLILINSIRLRVVKSIDGRKINQNSEFVNLIRQTLDKAEKNYVQKHSQ